MKEKKFLVEEINKLKKEKNAIILAHSYQNLEIDLVADFVGDSLYLSQKASDTDADIIVFAGVYFMAQTAKILSFDKKVLLPDINSGCKMADMINLFQIKEFKKQYPDLPVVCYINSTAEVKSECDICCTSSNAINIVKSLNEKEILFVPDKNLASFVQQKIPEVKIHAYDGCCPVHFSISTGDIEYLKEKHPDAIVLTHPECSFDVLSKSDFIGSTSQIIKEVEKSKYNEFIIVTEIGVVERLKRDFTDKIFYHISSKAICDDMKMHTLENILNSLKYEKSEIILDNDLAKKAYLPIKRMLDVRIN